MTEPENDEASRQANLAAVKRHNRTQMVVIMLIGLITLGGSYLAFYYAQSSGGWNTTNNGEFVDPPVSTQQLGWQVEGNQRRWWLWVVSDECLADCQSTVKNMQALQILLNREADRVRRGYTGTLPTDVAWRDKFPQLAHIEVTNLGDTKSGVYIVDPNGNLVLFYPMSTNPKLVLQDLKKLLKVSHIG